MIFQKILPTTHEERIKVIEDIIRLVDTRVISPDLDRYELFLVLDEALTNAMEHGNRWDPEKKVHLKIEKSEQPGAIDVSIKDEGIGFNPNSLPRKLAYNSHINVRGRGIFIIRRFCEVRWNITGNEMTMTIKTKGES